MGVLQLGVPGGPELFILTINLLLVGAIVYAVISLIRTHRRRSARLDELERRLGRHDRRLDELEEGN